MLWAALSLAPRRHHGADLMAAPAWAADGSTTGSATWPTRASQTAALADLTSGCDDRGPPICARARLARVCT